jgi:hypothetical protein
MKQRSSERKIAANRKNSQASTGPKTKLGKDKAKHNALKHGAYATSTLLIGEDKDLYSSIRSEQRRRYAPKTFVDKALVDQLVNELWTLRRITRAEYFLGREVQEEMREDEELDDDQLLGEQRKKLKLLKQKTQEFDQSSSSEQIAIQQNRLKVIRNTQEKLNLIDRVYLEFYCRTSQERTQKLMWLKRTCLQNILGIERELDRRLRRREKTTEDE